MSRGFNSTSIIVLMHPTRNDSRKLHLDWYSCRSPALINYNTGLLETGKVQIRSSCMFMLTSMMQFFFAVRRTTLLRTLQGGK